MWSVIDWNGKCEKSNEKCLHDSQIQKFFRNIFQSEQTKNHPKVADILTDLHNHFSYIPMLDDLPTLDEVKFAFRRIQRGIGIDGLPPLTLKIIPPSMINCILLLIQKVFLTSYPSDWNKQILHSITKKDHTYDNPDLRGIAIAPLLCRVYDNVIENRFSNWYKPNCQQAGFRKGQGCLMQIFMLNLLINYSRTKQKNLFVAFMDYSKAFDYANRFRIVSDLMKNRCGTNFTRAIANMYIETEYLPRLKGNMLGQSITTNYGVTQGRTSSAPIYSFYVSDMPDSLENIVCNDYMDPYNISQLADDTAIIAETLDSLAIKMESVLDYSREKFQVPNSKKTFFCNFTADPALHPIYLKNNIKINSIKADAGHKYLGMLYYPTNNLKKIIEQNIIKRMSNICKYYAWLDVNENTPVDIKLMVLDQCLLTSLLYRAETWGDISFIEEDIRKIETAALRRILRIKKTTTTDLVYFELNRADIISRIKDSQFKFFNKVTHLHRDEAVVRSILAMCDNDEMVHYYTQLHDNNQEMNILDRRNRLLYSDRSMIEYYRNTIGLNTTCLYTSMLSDYYRFIITRWRLSNHKLRIETLRYDDNRNIPRHMRNCELCNVLEDEAHVIFQCKKFCVIRLNHLALIRKNHNIRLFMNPDYEDIIQTASFLHEIENIIK